MADFLSDSICSVVVQSKVNEDITQQRRMVSCFWDVSEMCYTAPGGIGGGTDMLSGVNIWM